MQVYVIDRSVAVIVLRTVHLVNLGVAVERLVSLSGSRLSDLDQQVEDIESISNRPTGDVP
jgi:hypothetical protein